MKFIKTYFLLIFFIALLSCNNNSCKNNKNLSNRKDIIIEFLSPTNNQQFRWGDTILFQYEISSEKELPDSILFISPNGNKQLIDANSSSFSWNSNQSTVGKQNFGIHIIEQNKIISKSNINIEILSDIEAEKIPYKLIAKYPHQRDAYTQGLVYEDGIFYEGTGLNKESKLRKVDVKTGKVLYEIALSNNYFGEGICIWKDKIYQLTWQSNIAFVYNKNNFVLEKQLFYPTEGWGLTHDNKHLIMSDGSENIYFLDPENFKTIRKISVYDENGKVEDINELEYVNGKIYANIYDIYFKHFLIIVIDPKTGKVIEKCYLDNIINLKKVEGRVDVFNGIAYDSVKNHFFVTGKWWPFVYEIKM